MSGVGLRMRKELHGKACIGFEQHPTDKKAERYDTHVQPRYRQFLGVAPTDYAIRRGNGQFLYRRCAACGEIGVFILPTGIR